VATRPVSMRSADALGISMIRSDLPVGTPGRRSHNDAPEGIAARRPGESMSTETRPTMHQRRHDAVQAVKTVGRTREHGDPMPFPPLADRSQDSSPRPTDTGLGVRDQLKANSRSSGGGCALKALSLAGIVVGVAAAGFGYGAIETAQFNARADVNAARQKVVEVSPNGSIVTAVDSIRTGEDSSSVIVCVTNTGLPKAFSVDVQDGKFVADVRRDESADKLC
jgi:hypothetical protein